MNKEKIDLIDFWKRSAAIDHKTSLDLFHSGNYVGCLFFVHLFLEKILKGLAQKVTKATPPFTHDLLVLAKLARMNLTPDQQVALTEINSFNLRTRYADYKFSFYKKANKKFAVKYCAIAKELYQWFLKNY